MLPNDYAGYYNNLYIFQDKVLDIIFSFDNLFYLTGGTALTRFHNYYHRYSDDLDIFANKSIFFKSEFKEFIEISKGKEIIFDKTVESKDFIRVLFKEKESILQIDFVNDYTQRIEKPNFINGYKIDTINEIISNKFGAILNRDEPKDIADILEAYKQGYKDWKKAFDMAILKQEFAVEELIVRFETFPIKLLEKIKYVNNSIKEFHKLNCKNILLSIITEIAG
ncbi:MAG: nucleotidyl transferase AbiEii/AbiGii toxin family protein [Desulfobacterales bacterium]|nr:nucleotidyl transferase AbiEii/AbiGii toxin family protein [Desulfobacterales bacterium]MBF0395192.1 nucleotidyl transferase AbiEii/AbiGii toxin family protein [Desulfobacterales bacterium]